MIYFMDNGMVVDTGDSNFEMRGSNSADACRVYDSATVNGIEATEVTVFHRAVAVVAKTWSPSKYDPRDKLPVVAEEQKR